MEAQNPVPTVSSATPRVIRLPYAWYVSGDLIFELYQGGQPPQSYSIRWEHLKPIAKLDTPPAEAQ